MKLRLLPIIMSVVVTSVVLFGGWFAYKTFAMENPLQQMVKEAQGVENVEMNVKNDVVLLRLQLAPESSLREIVQQIRKEGERVIGKRKLDVEVTNASSPQLDQWWSSVLFDVAQAMETKQYSKIPEALDAKASQMEGLTYATEMDDTNVYVRLTHGEYSKYIVLPRIPAQLGVWTHE